MKKHNIKLWYNQLNNQYYPTDIYLVYIKKEDKKGLSPIIKEENEDDILVIKPLSNIKLTDVDATIKSNRRLILYFDKQIAIGSLSILKNSNYKFVYFDTNISSPNPLFIFQKMNPLLVAQNNITYIKDIISIFLNSNKNQKSLISLTQVNAFLLRNKRNISLETIQNDILFLEHYNKLTSRLAIFIYKLCTFEFDASEKEIGLYFSQSFGKSKPLNKKTYSIENVKGYDLGTYHNDPIYDTKVQIAFQLSNMQNQTINKYTILQATGIDISKT